MKKKKIQKNKVNTLESLEKEVFKFYKKDTCITCGGIIYIRKDSKGGYCTSCAFKTLGGNSGYK